MATFVREITTSQGDILRIGLSYERKLLSPEVQNVIGDAELMGVELSRISGSFVIGHEALQAIEEYIASIFAKNPDMMLFYFCDFINPIPHTSKKDMSPQEYRSRLFERMFERYVSKHCIEGVHLSVITVDGLDETYYFHLIYRDKHAKYAALIDWDIKEGYSK